VVVLKKNTLLLIAILDVTGLIVASFLLPSLVLPNIHRSRISELTTCPPHCSHNELLATVNGWDFGSPDGTNNPLQKYITETFTLTLFWVDLSHELAFYPPGTLPTQVSPTSSLAIGRSSVVDITHPTVTFTFNFAAHGKGHGVYEYYCDFHPTTMHGQITITIAGDVNGDFQVNIADFPLFLSQLGQTHATWDRQLGPRSDFNRDLQVNIADFPLFLANLGKIASP
jgi:hypothetical protein